MLRSSIAMLVLLILSACGSKGQAPELVGFEVTPIKGTDCAWAAKINHQGIIMEQGELLKGVPNGTWTAYHLDEQIPKSLTSLVNGKKTGPYLEFSQKGEMKLYAEFFNDIPHGRRIEFGSFGRKLKESSYKNGELHGLYSEWNNQGKLQKTMNYVDGKLDGLLAYYDQEGIKTVEYIYKNGEKVSGGVVNQEEAGTDTQE